MASTEANFSVTFKTPRGNLVTVRGDNTTDWVFHLDDAAKSGALGVITQIENTLAGQPKAPGASPVAQAAAAKAAAEAKPASTDDQELPGGFGAPKCETCGADTRFDKEGVSQNSGKPYKRYTCTTSQLHKATFTK
jgi:hypothetical protein